MFRRRSDGSTRKGGKSSAYSSGSITLLIRSPYTSAPVRAWKERAVTSPATFDIA
jgi:hypothetical protein